VPTSSQDSANRLLVGFCQFHRRVERDLDRTRGGSSDRRLDTWAKIKTHTPPVVFLLNTTSGLLLFNLIPTASSSCSSSRRCSSDFVASSMIRIRSAVFAAVGRRGG